LHDDAMTAYDEVKIGKKHQYVIFKIENNEVLQIYYNRVLW